MNKAMILKVAFVACLSVVGFGLATPAEAALLPCNEGYCEENPYCNCLCEGGGPVVCNKAPSYCFA